MFPYAFLLPAFPPDYFGAVAPVVPTQDPAQIAFMPMMEVTGILTNPPSSDPEGVFATTGRRPAFPLIVANINVLAPIEYSPLSTGASFLVGPGYLSTSNDGMSSAGAFAGYVGTKLSSSVVYRPPLHNEVVRFIDPTQTGKAADGGYYKWNGTVWKPYLTMPQRTIDNMNAFASLDPDGVYMYWASLLGGLQYALTSDATSLANSFDVFQCPTARLTSLAKMFGVPVVSTDPPDKQRNDIRDVIYRKRSQGFNWGVNHALKKIGYSGYVNVVWANIPAFFNNDWYITTQADGTTRTEIANAGLVIEQDLNCSPLSLDNANHGEGTSSLQGYGHHGPATFQACLDWFEMTQDNNIVYTATPGWFTPYPGGPIPSTDNADPTNYGNGWFPTSRVVVHVNNLDGTPLTTPVPLEISGPLKTKIANALFDILPMWVTIKAFATDTTSNIFWTYF